MASTFKSPYASAFKSAIKRGMPCNVVVESIAKRNNGTTKAVFNSLFKADLCYRQKFNGQWIYWPCEGVRGPSVVSKKCQTQVWQQFVDWCITSGICTPEKLSNCTGSQVSFMADCRKFWNKQTNAGTSKSTGRKRATSTSRKRRTATVSRRSTSSSRRRTTTRRYAA